MLINQTIIEINYHLRWVWRYQRGNQNPYIEEEQTTQWPKEKVQKNKQRSTKHTYKIKDRVTWTALKTGGELMCSGRVSSSCSTSHTDILALPFSQWFIICFVLIFFPHRSHRLQWAHHRQLWRERSYNFWNNIIHSHSRVQIKWQLFTSN